VRLGLGEAGRLGHLGGGQAARLFALGDGGEARPLGLRRRLHPLPFGRGQGLDLVALGVGLPPYGGVELLFLPFDLLLLDLDLDGLFLQLVGHLGLGSLAVGDRLLLGDGLGGLRVGDLRRPVRRGVGLLLAARLLGVGLGHRRVALGLGFLRQALRLRLLLAGLALGVGLGDRRFLVRPPPRRSRRRA